MAGSQLEKRQSLQGTGSPSLWVFLIIVLAVLFCLVLGTSFILHMVQRRQRTLLHRRIAAGEIDLEMLGIKRMNVPQEQIEKMPLYTFTTQPEAGIKPPAKAAKTDVRHSTMYSQATCAICLDDFVEDETQVRELPCKHIFHPECIDPFLKDNSSLCPLCKKSALLPGYCPVEVTNVMVRRERLSRHVRVIGRSAAMQHYLEGYSRARLSATGRTRLRVAETSDLPTPQTSTEPNTNEDTELGTIASRTADEYDSEMPPEIAAQGIEARRRWRRERLARQHAEEFDQSGAAATQAEARRPLWRRAMGLA